MYIIPLGISSRKLGYPSNFKSDFFSGKISVQNRQIRLQKIEIDFIEGYLLTFVHQYFFNHKYEGTLEPEFIEELFWHGYDLQVHAGPKFMIFIEERVLKMILL